ncbi:hypothetical protein HKD37_12G033750 [Glycine soja]
MTSRGRGSHGRQVGPIVTSIVLLPCIRGQGNLLGPITRTMSKRLQEDWARAAEEGPRVLMNLRTHLLLEVASPLSLPSPFRCHLSSKKQRNPLMKKILGLQAPMELAS